MTARLVMEASAIGYIAGALGLVGSLGVALRRERPATMPLSATQTAGDVVAEVLFDSGSRLIGWLFATVAFLGSWGYAVTTWGWLLGIPFGWLPALIIAWIMRYAWWLICYAVFLIDAFLV